MTAAAVPRGMGQVSDEGLCGRPVMIRNAPKVAVVGYSSQAQAQAPRPASALNALFRRFRVSESNGGSNRNAARMLSRATSATP